MKNDRLKGQPADDFEMSPDSKPVLKPLLLLTMAMFLMTAPTPDSRDIANISANLIAPISDPGTQGRQAGE